MPAFIIVRNKMFNIRKVSIRRAIKPIILKKLALLEIYTLIYGKIYYYNIFFAIFSKNFLY